MDLYWIWLSTVKGIGPVTQKKLLGVFQTPEQVYQADREELVKRARLRCNFVDLLWAARSLEGAKRIQDNLTRYNIRLLTLADQLYPPEVSIFPTSPAVLYYRGQLKEDSRGIAIVGSRRCTQYGKQVTMDTATYLAEQGITVISGMAKGIDGYAHTACLRAGGYTLAFLANGLDMCYPPEHQFLMEQIIEKGAVISPFPPQTRPVKTNFYKRNALMSAWSFKVLVVEAGMKSGTLITAQYAEQQKRPILAVPNSIYSQESLGTNQLISLGAQIYLEPGQLLPTDPQNPLAKKEVQVKPDQLDDLGPLSDLERRILDQLHLPQEIEKLVDIFDGNMAELLNVLCIMELEGKVSISQGKIISSRY